MASSGSVPWSSQRVCQRRVRRSGVLPVLMSAQAPVRSSRSAFGSPSSRTQPPWSSRWAQFRSRFRPWTKVWVPDSPRLRLSTTVSTGTPSAQLIPAPRQITASATQNQDLRAWRVEPRPLRCWPRAAYVPSVVPPTQRASGRAVPHSPPSRSARRLVETVVPGRRYQSTVGQNQSVYWSLAPDHQLTVPAPVCQPRGFSPLPHS